MTDIKVLASDEGIARIKVTDLEAGLWETSAKPVGNYRTSWLMQLRNRPEKCQIPRGFGRLSGKHI